MRIAIDPSLTQTGYAVAEGKKIIASGVIKTKPKDTLPARLLHIRCEITSLLIKYKKINRAIIEIQDSFGSYHKRQNKMTGKGLNQEALNKQNWAIGVIIIAIYSWIKNSSDEDCVKLVTTTQWKGKMSKEQAKLVASNIVRRKITNDNEAEAICLANYFFNIE